METPVPVKTPRRKLKRLTVKKKLSHKKLKTAINVSLNASHNLRTLRMNNRSLAHRLESIKKEYRAAFDAYQSIQEENHVLRQKVVSLECIISDPDSYIQEQVNRKFEAHLREFKNIIQLLHANVEGLSGNLKNLDEMCVTCDSPSTKMSKRCNSLDGILSRKLPSIPSPASLRFQNDITIGSLGDSNTKIEDEMNMASDSLDLNSLETSNEINERPLHDDPEMDKQKDMSMILEQSVIVGVKSPLKDIDRNIQPDKGTLNSKLPRRVLTRSREKKGEEPDIETTESSMKSIRKSRRATRILSDDEVNVLGILDMEAPSDLLLSPKLPSSSGDNDERKKDVDKPPINGDDGFKASPLNTCHNSNIQIKKKSNLKLHKKVNYVRRQAHVKQGKGSDGLFISNEFALINAHEQITKKLHVIDSTMNDGTRCEDDRDNGEHTVHMVEDMDLTMPVNIDINIPNNSENHFSNINREISDVESISSEAPNVEEFCPEAVTLQRMKPGQFKFAASRKETDGRRKSLLSQPPRARSKSKKAIAQMIENLPQEEPKSIFDFHDKTPTQISAKEKNSSVHSLRDELSVMSPPTPLGRMKSKSQMQGEKSSESNSSSGQECSAKDNTQVSIEQQPQTNETFTSDKDIGKDSRVGSVLGKGFIYSVPLKDDFDIVEKVTAGKPRGRSRNRKKSFACDLVEVSNNEDNPSIHTEKTTSPVDRITNCFSVQDDSSCTEKITVRNSRSKSQGRMSRARSKSRARSLANDEQADDSEEKMCNINEHVLYSQQSSKLKEGRVTRDVPLKHDSVSAEMIAVRKSQGQSQENHQTSLCTQHFADPQQVLNNQSNCDTLPKELSSLGEGITYSVPIKDNSDEGDKVTVRKSRGRSRTQGIEETAYNSEVANTHQRYRSRSQHRQNAQSEDESCETESHDMRRKSRGRSRARDKAKRFEKSEKYQTSVEREKMCSDEKPNATDFCKERPDKNLHQEEMITVRKSREQSQENYETSNGKQHFGNSKDFLSNHTNCDTLPQAKSALGEGITYSVPIKDDSDGADKVTVRKSRERSRTRANEKAAYNSEVANTHQRVRSQSQLRQNVQSEDESSETVSLDIRRKSRGRSRTRDKAKGSDKSEKYQTNVERERKCGDEETNATDFCEERQDNNLHQGEMVTVKNYGKQFQERDETSFCKQLLGHSQEIVSNQINCDTLPKEKSALGEGITYNVPITEDLDEAGKVILSKSRGRSRTRDYEAHDSEVASSHHRMRSKSRRRQNVPNEDKPCGTVSLEERRKSRGQSRTRDIAKGSEKPEKDLEGKGVVDDGRANATDTSVGTHEKNLHQQKMTTQSKPHNKTAGQAAEGAWKEEASEWNDEDVFAVDSELTRTEPCNRRSPIKSNKKRMPKSGKKMKNCEVKSTTASEENSKSPLRNRCTVSSSQPLSDMETLQNKCTYIESISTPTSPEVKNSTNVDGTMLNKSEGNERFGDGLCKSNLEDMAGSQQVKTSGSSRRKKKREQNPAAGKVVCDIQEKFQMQMEHLKNLYTPESFKRGKESQSPPSMNRQQVPSPSQSLNDSLKERSAAKDTDMEEPCDEPLKRRRAASKCANYTEPSLGGKLRRGDPFTSIGPGKVPIYKSPKAVKKIKVKRDVLGPLQNHLVKEETS